MSSLPVQYLHVYDLERGDGDSDKALLHLQTELGHAKCVVVFV